MSPCRGAERLGEVGSWTEQIPPSNLQTPACPFHSNPASIQIIKTG